MATIPKRSSGRMRRNYLKMHDVGPMEVLDRITLLVAFALGVGGGVFLKLIGAGPFVSSGFSAIVLVAYAVITYYSTKLRLEPEAIGDNCYYLGFLFTLTSLSVTLYFVVQAGEQDRAKLIPEVISGFGVALSSTIMGVFLRVLMMQFRVDIVVKEREARAELDTAARDLRTAIGNCVREMQFFTIESLQRIEERETAIKDQQERFFNELDTKFNNHYDTLNEQIRTKTTELAVETMKQITGETARMGSAMRITLHDAALQVMEEARNTFSALNQQGSELHQFRMTMTDELESLSAALSRVTRQIADGNDSAIDRLEQSSQRLAELERKLSAQPKEEVA